MIELIKAELSLASSREKLSIFYRYFPYIIRSAELQELFALDGEKKIRLLVFSRTEDKTLLELGSKDESPEVRSVIAERSRDPELLAQLAGDESPIVRKKVAGNKVIKKSTAELLSLDKSLSVKMALVENPSGIAADNEVSSRLVNTKNAFLILRLTENPRLRPEILETIISTTNDDIIIKRVIRHPNTPKMIALRFAGRFPSEVIASKSVDFYSKIIISMVESANREISSSSSKFSSDEFFR